MIRRRLTRRFLPFATCIIVALGFVPPGHASDPSALWHIVHDQCVHRAVQAIAPTPCAEVDLAGGYAVLKDIVGATQYLLIPTARVSGIEDPAILHNESPDYWQAAWQARRYMEQSVGHPVPRDMISLAINSPSGRTQDQLHIHIDCVRADVRSALQADQRAIGRQWSAFPQPLAGQHYRAMRIERGGLGAIDPFRLLAQDVKPAEMGQHTLVLVGADFSDTGPGFILLDGRVDIAAGDRGSGEALQDHDCALAR